MTSDSNQMLREAFIAARDFPRDEWRRVVQETCGGNRELCDDVMALLSASEKAAKAKFMARLDPELVLRALEDPMPEREEPMPERIGTYVIRRIIGRGGMGVVYEAYDPDGDRTVAIKELDPAGGCTVHARERFRREIRAILNLDHKNVLRAHHVVKQNEGDYLVMEYVDGLDMKTLVEKSGPLATSEACDAIRQAAKGLEHINDNKLVHRDVKPANLLRSADGTVKVTDLGLALMKDKTIGEQLTEEGMVPGTPDYVAPEVLQGAKADIRADVYGLGCTFYCLLSGDPPFAHRKDVAGKIEAHLVEKPRQLKRVPRRVHKILNRMLAKSPRKRFQTPAEVVRALEERDWYPLMWLVVCVLILIGGILCGTSRFENAWQDGSGSLRVSPRLLLAGFLWLVGVFGVFMSLVALVGWMRRVFACCSLGLLIAVASWFLLGSRPSRPFIGTAEMMAPMCEDADDLAPNDRNPDRKYYRFFTLTHLFIDDNVEEQELDLYRKALQELLEYFAGPGRSVGLVPVDEHETVYRLDLRDLDWHERHVWEAICSQYPYGLMYGRHADETIRESDRRLRHIVSDELAPQATPRSVPYVRADWFVAVASQAGLLEQCATERAELGEPPPKSVKWVVREYAKPLDLEAVASELGQEDVAAFRKQIEARAELRVLGLEELLEGGQIERQEWDSREHRESRFQKAAKLLGPVDSWIPPRAIGRVGRRFVGTKEMMTAMCEHLDRLCTRDPNSDKRYYRFCVLTHLSNRRDLSDVELDAHRQALRDLLAYFAGSGRTVELQPVDQQDTIFCVDLRELGWDKRRVWEAICSRYPYGLVYSQHSDEMVRELDQRLWQIVSDEDAPEATSHSVPYVRADWFVAVASQRPLLEQCATEHSESGKPLPESVELAVREYAKPLDLQAVASELGQEDVAAFSEQIAASDALRALGIDTLLEGGQIDRHYWDSRDYVESRYQKAAKLLGTVDAWTPSNHRN